MMQTRNRNWESPTPGSGLVEAADDVRVTRALKEYLVALEIGRKPDRRLFQAGHPEIAGELADYLDGLEFIQRAAPRLRQAAGLDSGIMRRGA